MKLQERSYSSKVFRPKPAVHMDNDGTLLVVATSWGEPEHALKVTEEVVKYVNAARGDVEVTSPFEFLTCLSDDANHLRIGTLIANDQLYRSENRQEYVSGVEVLAISCRRGQLAWAQVGAPHLLLQRKSRPLVPLAVSYDHTFELGLRGSRLAPLPSHLTGVDPTCNILSGDLQVQPGDSVVLLAASLLPSALWGAAEGTRDVAAITRSMIAADAELPFWLGVLEVE